MDFGGIKIYETCEGMIPRIKSIYNSVKLFVGGLSTDPHKPVIGSHVPPYMEEANLRFLKEAMGRELVRRDIDKVWIDPKEIHSGDAIMVERLLEERLR